MKTDIELEHDVGDALEWEPALDEANVRVSATDGVVSLSGRVHSVAEKEAAIATVCQVLGVLGVIDGMIVRPRAGTAQLKARLDRVLMRYAIEVNVRHTEIARVSRRTSSDWARIVSNG